MAASNSIKFEMQIEGNRKLVVGVWDLDNETTDEIATGLSEVEFFVLSHGQLGETLGTARHPCIVTEDFPLSSGNVTILGTAQDTGHYLAIGY